eukprot:TRINITY_DN17585_c0_g1_i1.p2 TRINITY_DN17585_c0_g1~~TRINITY_DN17585_c0_g1_i1.p2  ORF type:complete len:119 (+),score=14.51 TRINITY_DN17585_c0_g1_i1:279-635(+)
MSGATSLQGPHQLAWKSTSTGVGDSSTSLSKSASPMSATPAAQTTEGEQLFCPDEHGTVFCVHLRGEPEAKEPLKRSPDGVPADAIALFNEEAAELLKAGSPATQACLLLSAEGRLAP